MIKRKIALLLTAISFLLSGIAHADTATPIISTYPKSIIIPFAAKDKSLTLEFDLVNNDTRPVLLGNPQFIRVKSLSGKEANLKNFILSFEDKTRTCQIKSGRALMAGKARNGSCHIKVTFNATGVQPEGGLIAPEDYQLRVDYLLSAQAQPTQLYSQPILVRYATGELQNTLARNFSVVNLCNYPVWLGIQGNTVQNVNGKIEDDTSSSCSSDDDCYLGSSCASGKCRWINPIPVDGNYQLAANGGRTTLTFPAYANGAMLSTDDTYQPIEPIWSGTIAGRANCKAQGCEIADCGGNPNGCTRTFNLPVTKLEFTLTKNKTLITSKDDNFDTLDSYHVSIIDGITVPISMTPSNASWGGQSAAYTCGPAGGARTSPPLAACNWQFNPPSGDYIYVRSSTYDSCRNDADCNTKDFVKRHGTGMICGLSIGGSNVRRQCGLATPFYWSSKAVCDASGNAYNNPPFYCSSNIPNSGQLYADLYSCSGRSSKSCYTEKATNTCCGCSNWTNIFSAQPFKACEVTSNEIWNTYVLPELTLLKEACPLAAVYRYDDKSSEFTCSNVNSDHINVVHYTITFCPR